MTQPKPLSLQPGISINGHTLFMNGEAIGVLHADPARAHARQDFKDFLDKLTRASLDTPGDIEEYRVRALLEDEVEYLEQQVCELESEIAELRSQAVDA